MSAILDRPHRPHRLADEPLAFPAQLEPESIFSEAPHFRFDPAAELKRLRPLLADYDPRDEPVQYYHPPRDYGVLIAKFIGYSFLGMITLGIGLSILGSFTLGC